MMIYNSLGVIAISATAVLTVRAKISAKPASPMAIRKRRIWVGSQAFFCFKIVESAEVLKVDILRPTLDHGSRLRKIAKGGIEVNHAI